MEKRILDEHSQIFLEDYTQSYQGLFMHPEAGEDPGLNEALDNIESDLNNIDTILINTGIAIDDLLTNTVLRLDEVKKQIISGKERYQDIQMLCNRYMDFDNVKEIEDINFSGTYEYKNNVYSAKPKKTIKNNLRITGVYGNGYEGNEFVYNNYEYQKDVYDTSIRENMTDTKISTYYEYSRITILDTENETNSAFNKDSEMAKCTITFESNDLVNYINLSTEDLGINIIDIQYSLDGVSYLEMNLPDKLSLNNKLDSYDNYGYVYGSGVLSIPASRFFKITFTTEKNKDDVIAYEKTIFTNEDADVESNNIPKTLTNTTVVKSAKRSAIKINDISAYKQVYTNKTKIVSDELITAESYSIGVFANVYIPQGLEEDSVEFILTINGEDYPVVPINSDLNGTKIVRFSGGKSNTAYTELLSEVIKSAQLSIIFKSMADCSPMINNIKILVGGEI